MKDKKYRKVKDHCHYTGEYRGTVHSICNSKYSVSKKNYIVFQNGSSDNYYFIIKELEEQFRMQFTYLGENTEKYITFIFPVEKEVTIIDKNGEEITKNTSYILQIIDSTMFMTSSLSNLYNNLSEGIHRTKCKYRDYDKKCKTFRIKYNYCNCYLECTNFKDDLIEYRFSCCNKNYQHKLMRD